MKNCLNVALLQLRHDKEVADEEAILISTGAGLQSSEMTVLRLYAGIAKCLEKLAEYDALIIGGSDVSVLDHQQPWWSLLNPLLHQVIRSEIPYWGTCYGFQAMALILGGSVMGGPEWTELGSVPVELTEEGAADPLFCTLPNRFHVQTGHHDSITELPQDAVQLVKGNGVQCQAARFGPNAYGTQFHTELDLDSAKRRMERFRERDFGDNHELYYEALGKLKPSPYVVLPLRRFIDRVRGNEG